MVGRKDHQQEETEGGWSFTHPDVDGTGSSSLLDSIISTPLKKKQCSDVWVVAFLVSSQTISWS